MCQRLAIAISLAAILSTSIAAEPTTPKYPRMVRGKITDPSDNPIEGARVEYGFFTAEESDREIVLTDKQGDYELPIHKAGRGYRLGVYAKGYAPQFLDEFIPGHADQPSNFSTKLEPGRDITIRFVSQAGEPASELKITPTTPSAGFISSFSHPPPPSPYPGSGRTVTTDADGKVTLRNLPSFPTIPNSGNKTNWIGLTVARGNHVYPSRSLTVKQVKESDGVISITLPNYQVSEKKRDGVLRYRVVDEETGEPIKRFRLVRRFSTQAETVSDDEGRLIVGKNLENGRRYQVRVFADGYEVGVARHVAQDADHAEEHLIKLTKHPSFRGKLVDTDGKPLAHVPVLAGHAAENSYTYIEWSTWDSYADGHHSLKNVLWCETDENGEFVVPESPDAPVSLIIKTVGFARTVVPPSKRPKPDLSSGTHSIELQKAATLILKADRNTQLGATATGVGLQFETDDGFSHMYHGEELNEQGERVYESMAAGDYWVALYKDTGNSNYPIHSTPVTLTAGETVRVPLGQMIGDLTLSGVAKPFAMVSVAYQGEPEGPNHFAVQADIDGEFKLEGLLSADYWVSADNSAPSRGFFGRGRRQKVKLEGDMEIELRTFR